MPTMVVFASGSKTGGGSGFKKLVEASRDGRLNSVITAVVSNNRRGGVYELAKELGIEFIHQDGDRPQDYEMSIALSGAYWIAFSGWLLIGRGLPPHRTFNIHPALLSVLDEDGDPRYGGKGKYGHYVHENVYADGCFETGFTMHFVTAVFDDPAGSIVEVKVPIIAGDTPESIGQRVNRAEHEYQWRITDDIVNGRIKWSGIKGDPVIISPEALTYL